MELAQASAQPKAQPADEAVEATVLTGTPLFGMTKEKDATDRARARFAYADEASNVTVKGYFPQTIADALVAGDDSLDLSVGNADPTPLDSGSVKLQWEQGEVLVIAWVPGDADIAGISLAF